jgi:hypothetical protein
MLKPPQAEPCYNFIEPQYTVYIKLQTSHLNIFVAMCVYKIIRCYFQLYLIHVHTFSWNIFQDETKLISGSQVHCILLNIMTTSVKVFNNTETCQ